MPDESNDTPRTPGRPLAGHVKVSPMGRLHRMAGRMAATLDRFSSPAVDTVGISTTRAIRSLEAIIPTWRAEQVAREVALQIPAMRKADLVITGTLGTLPLSGWEGKTRLDDTDPRVAWLIGGPEPGRTRQWTMSKIASDLLWYDRCIWRVVDWYIDGRPVAASRVHPSRVDAIRDPRDPDTVTDWLIDGQVVADPSNLIVFDGSGLGGLDKIGGPLLHLYAQLQTAAGRYAQAPHPHAILKNTGADLSDDEIDALLDRWEQQRMSRSVAYMNAVVDYTATGYSAKDLQLLESREHAALEVSRLTGLPPYSVSAKVDGSMTYQNVRDVRVDEVNALRPYLETVGQTLSINDRTRGRLRGAVVPRGITVRVDTSDYLRADAITRMQTWAAGIDSGVLNLDEARAQEPLARS